MPLDIADGMACFIDANILYYHFVDVPVLSQASTAFLDRVTAGTIEGFSSLHVVAEAVHKVMLAEAASRFGLSRAGLVNWLQHHRDRITELHQFREAADEFFEMRIPILPMDSAILQDAARLSSERGLLTNDAIVLSLIQRNGLKNLITNDDDFDGIPDLAVWKPR